MVQYPYEIANRKADRGLTLVLTGPALDPGKELRARAMMLPGNEITVAPRRDAVHKRRRPKPVRCSICTGTIWFHPIALKEPQGAPEPRREWVLCRSCHEALLTQMRLSPVRSPLRLRIALGLVAAERDRKSTRLNSSHVKIS